MAGQLKGAWQHIKAGWVAAVHGPELTCAGSGQKSGLCDPENYGPERSGTEWCPTFPGDGLGAGAVLRAHTSYDDEVILDFTNSFSPANGLKDSPTYKSVRCCTAVG